MSRTALRNASIVLMVLAVVAIVVLTLTPLGAERGRCALGLPCPLGHFGAFALLGASLGGWFAASEAARRSPQRVLVMVLLAVWLFAALDELAQPYFGRNADFGDWLLDFTGGITGLLLGSAALRALLRLR